MATKKKRKTCWQVQKCVSDIDEWFGCEMIDFDCFDTKAEAEKVARQVTRHYYWKTRVVKVIDD